MIGVVEQAEEPVDAIDRMVEVLVERADQQRSMRARVAPEIVRRAQMAAIAGCLAQDRSFDYVSRKGQ